MLVLSCLTFLIQSRTNTGGQSHINPGSVMAVQNCLEEPSQACPKVCLLGNTKSNQIENNIKHHNM